MFAIFRKMSNLKLKNMKNKVTLSGCFLHVDPNWTIYNPDKNILYCRNCDFHVFLKMYYKAGLGEI